MGIETRVTVAYFLGIAMVCVGIAFFVLWDMLTEPEYISTLTTEENIK